MEYMNEDCPPPKDFYYALGIIGEEFDHHLWISEKEAREFYKKPGRNLIKGWKIELFNEIKFAKRWQEIDKICKEAIKKFGKDIKKGKLSLEELSSKLPDTLD